jgi:DNA modification methylase
VSAPYVQDADFTLLNCDVLEGLASLSDESVHCVVTSPPYWGLRDYGTGLWDGGDPNCDHKPDRHPQLHVDSRGKQSRSNTNWDHRHDSYADECGKCGARRQDHQLGLEPTPEEYVARMVDVFREVRRVLRRDGTLWLNMGDGYAQGGKHVTDDDRERNREITAKNDRYKPLTPGAGGLRGAWTRSDRAANTAVSGLKSKDLVGMPWRLAFALQQDGWYLRADIIWSKPNPMPESVTDRPTKAHEYVFLLTKSPRYFFDAEAVREKHNDKARPNGEDGLPTRHGTRDGVTVNQRPSQAWQSGGQGFYKTEVYYNPAGRNVRSVWEIATQPYPEAHFATYPEELVRRCILAGTSERGCCPECGKPWERETDTEYLSAPTYKTAEALQLLTEGRNRNVTRMGDGKRVATLGWLPVCFCDGTDPIRLTQAPIPCTVLDPFLGSGTTAYVARQHGRRSIGIELAESYCALAARRLQQQSLFAV